MRFFICGLLTASIVPWLIPQSLPAQDVPSTIAPAAARSIAYGGDAPWIEPGVPTEAGAWIERGEICDPALAACETGCPPCDDLYRISPPNMIGDFFGSAGTALTIGDQFPRVGPAGFATDTFIVPNPATSVVGRQKIAENNSPIPRDRIYMSYSHYNDARLVADGTHIHRYTPGLEAAFWNGLASVEVRVPFASTMDSVVALGGVSPTQAPNSDFVVHDREMEFGNVNINLKFLLYQSNSFALSAGSGVTIPTADDIVIKEERTPGAGGGYTAGGTTLARIENDAIHVLPFLAASWTGERLYAIGFTQVDFDTNGNDVFADVDALAAQVRPGTVFAAGFPATGLRDIGRADDATYLYADLGVGYWLYRKPHSRGVKALIPTAEIHYSRALEGSHRVGSTSLSQNAGAGRDFVRFDSEQIDLLNGVIGCTAMLADSTSFTLGYGFPLKSSDKQWDWEVRAVFNWFLR